MLTLEEIRRKAEVMERLATHVREADVTGVREVALRWRLLEIEAVFMKAIRPSVAPTP